MLDVLEKPQHVQAYGYPQSRRYTAPPAPSRSARAAVGLAHSATSHARSFSVIVCSQFALDLQDLDCLEGNAAQVREAASNLHEDIQRSNGRAVHSVAVGRHSHQALRAGGSGRQAGGQAGGQAGTHVDMSTRAQHVRA